MFNGIIFNKGKVYKIHKRKNGVNLFLKSAIKLFKNDLGISIGFGIRFGVTKNQIDFGLNLINRSDSYTSDKLITNFNIGISIGDLWFVKRRVKK